MTRHSWFNCSAGVAGDMLLASLVDAGADPIAVGSILAGLGLDDYALTFEPTQRAGVKSTRAIVAVHEHDDHDRHHGSHHRAWSDIKSMIEAADVPERVRVRSLAVFAVLADVEAKIHGVDVDDVEFHEVGAVDSIVDIVGVCAALEVLGVDSISCGPIGTGHGTVRTQHGELPNPAPATVSLAAMRQIPLVGLDDRRELATPTGVAVMAALADTFGAMPGLSVHARGYGAGALDVNGRANVVQVVVGDRAVNSSGAGQAVRLLEVNVDDVTGEVIAHTIGALLDAGAHDAWATPIVMKKGRPAHTVHALCDPALTDAISRVMLNETGSLGVRGSIIERWPQARREGVVRVEGHEIRVKIAGDRVKVEHDDAARAAEALGIPLREVLRLAESAAAT
ncbi:MAG: nickel pincer cofactor biosynthesis protein LarC [Actinobacteria bacterium]|nr:nickel pincer cofactor biosynthesis protein LarC [Actinomycetota bacterium]